MDKDKILPPVILAVIIFFFLQIVFGISFIFVLAIMVVVIMIIIMMKIGNIIATSSQASSLISKLPSLSIKTILVVLVVVVIIVLAISWAKDQGPRSANHFEVRLPEEFNNDTRSKDYGYNRINNRDFNGDYVIEDGKMQVLGGIRLTNTDLLYEHPTFKFSIGRLEAGEVATISVLFESEYGICPFTFTVKGPTVGHSAKRVTFGVNEHDRIWVKIDNSQIDVGNYQFDTSTGSFDLVMDITSNKVQDPKDRKHPRFFEPSFNLDDIVFG